MHKNWDQIFKPGTQKKMKFWTESKYTNSNFDIPGEQSF